MACMMVRWKNGDCSAGLVKRRGEGLFTLLGNCSDPKVTVLL